MAQNIVRRFNPTRLRSWFNRVPLFTRLVVVLILGVWGTSFAIPWILTAGALVPAEVGLMSSESLVLFSHSDKLELTNNDLVQCLNTYPVVHSGIIQLAFTLTALVPLLQLFEAEHGTLICLAMFIGRKLRI